MATKQAMAAKQAKEEIQKLSASAFEAERTNRYKEAYELHGKAISKFKIHTNDAKFGLTDANFGHNYWKEVAQHAINIHRKRQQALEPVVKGAGEAPPKLPTLNGAVEELKHGGRRPITSDATTLYLWAADPRKKANPAENQKHLLQVPVPFYVPTLDLKIPDVTYRIRRGRYGGIVLARPRLLYYDVMDESDKQTLYTLRAHVTPNVQLPFTILYRTAEFAMPCVHVSIAPIKTKTAYGMLGEAGARFEAGMTGRPLELTSGVWGTIKEAPDRLEKVGWAPRRFSYGGRRFVWKKDGKHEWDMDALYEVEKEWPKPDSKTGKKEEKVFERKLVWGKYENYKDEVGTIHFAGGIDQIFREYLLASELTKYTVLRGSV